MIKLFFIIGTAHFIGDYLLYTDNVSVGKRSGDVLMVWYNFMHALVHATIAGVLLFDFFGYDAVFAIKVAKVLFWIHFLIDYTRCFLEAKILKFDNHAGWRDLYRTIRDNRWHMEKKYIISGVIDQSVHLVSLIIVAGVMV